MPLPTLVDWNHEKSLFLISKFKTHEALWNPSNKSFHNPKKKEDAWWALAKEINVPATEVKRKIEGLRGSYRRERSKVRSSKEKEEKYSPKWFAYKSLAFLEETRPQDVSDSVPVGGDLDVVSTANIIPHPLKLSKLYSSEKKSEYAENHQHILPHVEFELSSKERRFCRSDSFKPRPNPESMKEKPGLEIETMMEGTIRDPLGTLTHCQPQSNDGTGLPDKLEEEKLPCDKCELSPKKRRFCSTSGPYKPIRPASKGKKLSLEIEPTMDVTICNPPGTLTEPQSKDGTGLPDKLGEDVLPQDKFKLSPKKRRFRSTSGPYKHIRLKPESKKEKSGRGISDTDTICDPPGTSTEPPSKDGTGLIDKPEKETLQPWVDRLQENVGFSIGYFSDNSTSKSENTTSKPAIPEQEVLGREFSQGVNRPEAFEINNKPLQRQEDDKLDECTAFGQLVESSLRQLPVLQRIKAKMKLSQVLWEVELEALNHSPPFESHTGSPKTTRLPLI